MDATQTLASLGTAEGRADPYPLYAGLHELGEAHERESLDDGGGERRGRPAGQA